MITYEVTNLLPTSLTIEDIGVNLQPAGGTQSSKVLSEHTYKASRHIRSCEQRKWVKVVVRRAFVPRPIPVWPFSKAPPAPAPPPPPSTPAASRPSRSEVVLAGLIQKLEILINRVQSAPTSSPAPQQTLLAPARARLAEDVSVAADPLFIPSSIVPTTAEVRIRVDESTTEKGDFESGTDALRKLRKKP